jgi:hypothetical protein
VPTIDIQAMPKWVKTLGPAWKAAAERGLYSAALKGVQLIVGQIIPSRTPQPVDRGVYRAGWRAVQETGGARIENVEPHADFIEFGVRAGNVKVGAAMLRALAAWAERKGLAKKGGGGMQVAWAIAGAMKKKGIFNSQGRNGLGILRELVEKPENLFAIIEKEIAKEIRKETKASKGG